MRAVVTLVLSTVLVLALEPAFAQSTAQSPGAATMPPGAQNPAVVQPTMIPPAQLTPQPAPAQPAPPPAPAQTPESPTALITPDTAAGGLCECLINHDPHLPVYDKTKMHQRCLGSPEACQAECQTDRYFSFVPHAIYTCPGPTPPETGHIAMNSRPPLLLSRRR